MLESDHQVGKSNNVAATCGLIRLDRATRNHRSFGRDRGHRIARL